MTPLASGSLRARLRRAYARVSERAEAPLPNPDLPSLLPSGAEGAPALPAAALVAGAADLDRRLRRRDADRAIWSLTWPVILSQAFASVVSLADLAMLATLGTEALAAVGYATQFFHLAQAMLMAIGIACVALMARAIGARQLERARAAFASALVLSLFSAALVASLAFLVPAPLMRALGATPRVIELAVPYLQLTLSSTLLFAVSLAYENAFRAARDTRTPMAIAGAVTLAKIGLNFVLIFGWFGFPRLDLVGAGLATLLAQVVAVALFVAAARREDPGGPLRLRTNDFRAARPLLADTARVAWPAVLERVTMNAALLSYFAVLGSYGPAAVAAYTVGVRVLSFSWIPGAGFSAAAATLVGQALGGGDPVLANRAGWRAVRLALLVSLVLCAAFLLAREPLSRAFSSDPAVLELLVPFMVVMAASQPFMALHFTLGGALRGAGDTLTPLWAALLGNWAFRVPLAVLLASVLELGVFYVWLSLTFDHIARAIWLLAAFYRGRWKRGASIS